MSMKHLREYVTEFHSSQGFLDFEHRKAQSIEIKAQINNAVGRQAPNTPPSVKLEYITLPILVLHSIDLNFSKELTCHGYLIN